MYYSLEKRIEIVEAKPVDMDVRTYCKNVGIAYSTYYKWYKDLNDKSKDTTFVDVTELVSECENISTIKLEISNISIHVNTNYNENHLLNVIRTLKKL